MQTFPQSHFWMCLDKYQKIALLVVIIWEKHTAKCIVIDCFVGIYDQPNDSLKDPKAPRGIEIALALCRRSIACTSYHHRKRGWIDPILNFENLSWHNILECSWDLSFMKGWRFLCAIFLVRPFWNIFLPQKGCKKLTPKKWPMEVLICTG